MKCQNCGVERDLEHWCLGELKAERDRLLVQISEQAEKHRLEWVAAMAGIAGAERLIREYQLAIRKVDQCCGCLNYGDRFKTLDRGKPGPKCEDCNREQLICRCADKQQQPESKLAAGELQIKLQDQESITADYLQVCRQRDDAIRLYDECLKIAESNQSYSPQPNPSDMDRGWKACARDIAESIRQLKQTEKRNSEPCVCADHGSPACPVHVGKVCRCGTGFKGEARCPIHG